MLTYIVGYFRATSYHVYVYRIALHDYETCPKFLALSKTFYLLIGGMLPKFGANFTI